MKRVRRFSSPSSPAPLSRGAGRVRKAHRRRGASALDYILILGATLPIVAFVLTKGVRMIQLVYEMTCVLVAWPFM